MVVVLQGWQCLGPTALAATEVRLGCPGTSCPSLVRVVVLVLTGVGPTALAPTEVGCSCFPNLVRVVAVAVAGPQHGVHV